MAYFSHSRRPVTIRPRHRLLHEVHALWVERERRLFGTRLARIYWFEGARERLQSNVT